MKLGMCINIYIYIYTHSKFQLYYKLLPYPNLF